MCYISKTTNWSLLYYFYENSIGEGHDNISHGEPGEKQHRCGRLWYNAAFASELPISKRSHVYIWCGKHVAIQRHLTNKSTAIWVNYSFSSLAGVCNKICANKTIENGGRIDQDSIDQLKRLGGWAEKSSVVQLYTKRIIEKYSDTTALLVPGIWNSNLFHTFSAR